jgi:hypothetical protein
LVYGLLGGVDANLTTEVLVMYKTLPAFLALRAILRLVSAPFRRRIIEPGKTVQRVAYDC